MTAIYEVQILTTTVPVIIVVESASDTIKRAFNRPGQRSSSDGKKTEDQNAPVARNDTGAH